jgi:hypothetical protein
MEIKGKCMCKKWDSFLNGHNINGKFWKQLIDVKDEAKFVYDSYEAHKSEKFHKKFIELKKRNFYNIDGSWERFKNEWKHVSQYLEYMPFFEYIQRLKDNIAKCDVFFKELSGMSEHDFKKHKKIVECLCEIQHIIYNCIANYLEEDKFSNLRRQVEISKSVKK